MIKVAYAFLIGIIIGTGLLMAFDQDVLIGYLAGLLLGFVLFGASFVVLDDARDAREKKEKEREDKESEFARRVADEMERRFHQ